MLAKKAFPESVDVPTMSRIYFILCQTENGGTLIAIAEGNDLREIMDRPSFRQHPPWVESSIIKKTILGGMSNPGSTDRLATVQELFEDLEVEGYLPDECPLYIPNRGLLEWILENARPCDEVGRQSLIGLYLKADVNDDLIRFKSVDGDVSFKRYGDLTLGEAAEFTERLNAKALKSQGNGA
jgi:hypothetical protein